MNPIHASLSIFKLLHFLKFLKSDITREMIKISYIFCFEKCVYVYDTLFILVQISNLNILKVIAHEYFNTILIMEH